MYPHYLTHGPVTRYLELQVAHGPGMPGLFSPPRRINDPNMHNSMCMRHVPWCMPRVLPSGVLWNWWQRKYSRHSQHMHNPQFHVSGKRPMMATILSETTYLTQCQRSSPEVNGNKSSQWLPNTSFEASIINNCQNSKNNIFYKKQNFCREVYSRPPVY